MKQKILLILFLILIILTTSCSYTDFSEIKKEDFIGKKISVKGKVVGETTINGAKAFIIEDINKMPLIIASEFNPKPDEIVLMRGVIRDGDLMGNYLVSD